MRKHLFEPIRASAQISDFAENNFPNAKTLIWANQNAQLSVFAFGKLVSAKLLFWLGIFGLHNIPPKWGVFFGVWSRRASI